MKLTLAYKFRLLHFLVALGVFGLVSKSFARSIDEDRPVVEDMLKNPKYKTVFEKSKQTQWLEYKKENGGWGGGNTIRRFANDRPILLDLFTLEPTFRDVSFNHQPLVETAMMKFMGMETIKVQQLSAYAGAQRILAGWKSSNRGLVDLIQLSMDNLTVSYVWRSVPLAAADTYFLPQSLTSRFSGGVLTPCVAYHEKFGLIISATEWNQLGDLSQSALLIHEALRRVQLSYGLTVSQEKLQLLTATIALRSPDENIELESPRFLDQKLLAEIRRVSTWKIAPFSSHENLCRLSGIGFSGVKKSVFIWEEPVSMIESFCETIPKVIKEGESFESDFRLNPRVDEFYQRICQSKNNIRTDKRQVALEAWLVLKLQVSDMTERFKSSGLRSHELSEIINFGQQAYFFRDSLPVVLSVNTKPAEAEAEWQKWNQKFCGSGQSITEDGFLSAIRLLFLAGKEASAAIDEAAEAYVSLYQKSPKLSTPQIVEKLVAQRRAEEEAKNNYKDTLWEKIVTKHVNGETLIPEFMKIVQGLRATEEYLRRNIVPESLRF